MTVSPEMLAQCEGFAGHVEVPPPVASGSSMWSFLLYVAAVSVGLLLYMLYEPAQEKPSDYDDDDDASSTSSRTGSLKKKSGTGGGQKRSRRFRENQRLQQQRFQLSSLFAALGLSVDDAPEFSSFRERFHTFDEVATACRRAGLEQGNLIIGVDFTASNEWQGRRSFGASCLHRIPTGQSNTANLTLDKLYNPYQKVIFILGQTLQSFDEDNLLPAYGFGDSRTADTEVFPFHPDGRPCRGFREVLERYNDQARTVTLGGPTSFAPVIHRTIDIVKGTGKYHILVIIADGQVTEEKPTIDAIVEASLFAISIIVVGVGDGPWDIMEEFDHRLPKRKFDNFRFVDYHRITFKSKNADAAFALQALMEIPDQFKAIKELGYLDTLPALENPGTSSMAQGEGNTSGNNNSSFYMGATHNRSRNSSPTHSVHSTVSDCSVKQRTQKSTLATAL